MRAFVTLPVSVALALVCALPAQAEKWKWFEVKGGAVAYDEDSRKEDPEAGSIAANTLIYYEKARPVGDDTYHYVAERLELECRGQRHRWSQSAVLDLMGRIVVAREDGDWTPVGQEMGSTALFKRLLCTDERPPNLREAADLEAVMTAMSGVSAAERAAAPALKTPPVAPPDPDVLAAYAATLAPRPATPQSTAPKTPPPNVTAQEEPILLTPGRPVTPAAPVIAAAPPKAEPAPSPAPVAEPKPAPPPVAAAAPAPAPAARTAPTVSTAGLNLARPSASDQRCVTLKEQDDLRWWAFNDCSYTVSYAWCVTGGNDQRFDCAATLPGLTSSTVATRGRTLTPYMGGVGRRHVFVCRAPATPHVREVAPGRFEHQCASPARAAAPARPATSPPQASRPLPKLRSLDR